MYEYTGVDRLDNKSGNIFCTNINSDINLSEPKLSLINNTPAYLIMGIWTWLIGVYHSKYGKGKVGIGIIIIGILLWFGAQWVGGYVSAKGAQAASTSTTTIPTSTTIQPKPFLVMVYSWDTLKPSVYLFIKNTENVSYGNLLFYINSSNPNLGLSASNLGDLNISYPKGKNLIGAMEIKINNIGAYSSGYINVTPSGPYNSSNISINGLQYYQNFCLSKLYIVIGSRINLTKNQTSGFQIFNITSSVGSGFEYYKHLSLRSGNPNGLYPILLYYGNNQYVPVFEYITGNCTTQDFVDVSSSYSVPMPVP